jgi:hypothetical protein
MLDSKKSSIHPIRIFMKCWNFFEILSFLAVFDIFLMLARAAIRSNKSHENDVISDHRWAYKVVSFTKFWKRIFKEIVFNKNFWPKIFYDFSYEYLLCKCYTITLIIELLIKKKSIILLTQTCTNCGCLCTACVSSNLEILSSFN